MPLTAFEAWSPVACVPPSLSLAVLWYLCILDLPDSTGDTCMPRAMNICPPCCEYRYLCVLRPFLLIGLAY